MPILNLPVKKNIGTSIKSISTTTVATATTKKKIIPLNIGSSFKTSISYGLPKTVGETITSANGTKRTLISEGVMQTTLPDYMGGGSYTTNLKDTNQVINSGHTTYGGVETKSGFERADIIPVSLGGVNQSKENITYEPYSLWEKIKDKFAQVTGKSYIPQTKTDIYLKKEVLPKYKAGQITLNDARLMAYDFLQKEMSGSKDTTLKQLPSAFGNVSNYIEVGNKIKDFFGIYVPTKEEAQKNPLQNIKEAGSALTDTVKNSADNLMQVMENEKAVWDNPKSTGAEKLSSSVNVINSALGGLFSVPISIFEAAKKIPALQPAVNLVNIPFAIAGNTVGFVSDRFIDAMPVSQETKDELKPAFHELSSTAGMVILGGKIMDTVMKGGKLDKKTIDEAVVKAKEIELKIPVKVENTPKTKIPVKVADNLQPLAQEARKYSSAEEFVKAMTEEGGQEGVLFHGTPVEWTKLGDNPLFMAPDSLSAKTYGESIKGFIPKEGKTLDLTKAGVTSINQETGISKTYNTKFAPIFKDIIGGEKRWTEVKKTMSSLPENVKADLNRDYEGSLIDFTKSMSETERGKIWNAWSDWHFIEKQTKEDVYGRWKEVLDYAKKNGYDYVTHLGEDMGKNYTFTETIALNPKKSLTSLTDFYNQATKGVEGGKPVEVAKPLEPIGGGETKTSGLSLGVEAKAVEAKLTKGLGDLPEYKTVNMKEQAQKATDFLKNEPEKALKVARGEELPPNDILPESIFTAVENQALAKGDVGTLRDLAKSSLTTEATAMGQRIRALAERNPDSAVKAMQDVIKGRKERVQTKYGKNVKDKIVNNIKREIEKTTPKVKEWQDLLNKIACK
jgi:hypothetical protein